MDEETRAKIVAKNNDLNVIVDRIGPWGEPHGILKLPVGTKVVYTNDYGISFPGKTIVKTGADEYGDTYFLEPTDTPWFPCRRRNLTLQGNA